MNTLRIHYNQQLNEAFLTEMLGDREDIKEFVRELTDIFEEYNEAVIGIDDDYLVEAAAVGALKPRQISKLFKGVERVSKGLSAKAGLLGGAKEKIAAGKELLSKMNAAIKKAGAKLQETEPVQNFDAKVEDALGKWKDKLGPTHKAVEAAEKFGDWAKENPKKTAFAIGVLTALTSAIGSPAFGMAAGVALRTAVGLAKGEKASSAIGGAIKLGALASLAGGLAGELFSALKDAGEAAIDMANPVRDVIGETGFRTWGLSTNINGQQFDFNGLVDNEHAAALEKIDRQVANLKVFSDEWYEGTAKRLAAYDKVFNNPELQQQFAEKLEAVRDQIADDTVKQQAEQAANDAAQAMNSKANEIARAIGQPAAGGAAAAAGEKGKR